MPSSRSAPWSEMNAQIVGAAPYGFLIQESCLPCCQPSLTRPAIVSLSLWRESRLKRHRTRAVDLPGIRKASDNQVTTTPATPDGGRRAQTPISVWPAVIRPNATPSDETARHGMQEVRGSNPLSSTLLAGQRHISIIEMIFDLLHAGKHASPRRPGFWHRSPRSSDPCRRRGRKKSR